MYKVKSRDFQIRMNFFASVRFQIQQLKQIGQQVQHLCQQYGPPVLRLSMEKTVGLEHTI